ncbi:hypothetical protein [Nannocystis pusilla]|uniref:hypothetical protein n=1 Tax=Nannocystis pusilla TaxID=889268 RepID=UPI003DA25C01
MFLGIRRAISLLLLSLYFWNFLLVALVGPEDLYACYAALAAVYGVAFVGVAAEWFWARWFAIGLGQFGAFSLLALPQTGPEPSLLVFGISHVLVALFLGGEGMAARYERSEACVERYNFQEESLILLRRSIKSAGMSLPFLILFTLAPRQDALHLTALGLGVAALVGLIRGRTWGLFAAAGAGAIALGDGLGLFGAPTHGYFLTTPSGSLILHGPGFALLASLMLLVPLAFARPLARWLRA